MSSEEKDNENPVLDDVVDEAAQTPPDVDRRAFMTTVAAMALTATEMNSKYKETSEGGLAVSVTLC